MRSRKKERNIEGEGYTLRLMKVCMVKEVQSGPFDLGARACLAEKLAMRRRHRKLRYPYTREPSSRARTYVPTSRNFSISKLYARLRALLPEKYEYPRSGEASAPVIVRRFHPLSWEVRGGRARQGRARGGSSSSLASSSRKNGSTPGSG